jgi:glycosyltransferase involved in cell wall biosynthesis
MRTRPYLFNHRLVKTGEFGATVFDFPRIDDFAAARNGALSHATGEYAFRLDADDVLRPGEREKLRELLERLRADAPATYMVFCACVTRARMGRAAIRSWIILPASPIALYGGAALRKRCWSPRLRPEKGPPEGGTPANRDRRRQCYAVLNHAVTWASWPKSERGEYAEARRLCEAILAECSGDVDARRKSGRSTARGTPVPAARS